MEGKGTILIVDDNAPTRTRAVRALEAAGYRTHEAADGHEAFQKAISETPSGIMLDLIMPGFDGWQFRQAQLAHPTLKKIPTVIVSVRHLREQDRYVLRPTGVVEKPFEDSALVQAINAAVHSAGSHHLPGEVERHTSGLLWSWRGQVACANHAPQVDSEQWFSERWAEIPADAARHGLTYQCQYCAPSGSPLAKGSGQSSSTDRALHRA